MGKPRGRREGPNRQSWSGSFCWASLGPQRSSRLALMCRLDLQHDQGQTQSRRGEARMTVPMLQSKKNKKKNKRKMGTVSRQSVAKRKEVGSGKKRKAGFNSFVRKNDCRNISDKDLVGIGYFGNFVV